MTVYVVMNEGQLGGGGFEWFYLEEPALREYSTTLKIAPPGTYVWLVYVEVPDNADLDEITQIIEDQIPELQRSNKPNVSEGDIPCR